jgi:hypothetical protein
LDAGGRAATDEVKRALVKYVGWGGIPQVFAWHATTDWEGEREKLNALLTPEEYEAARASTLNAHYTSAIVINGIYEAVQRLGFSHGRILEPAAGIGHFFGLMPKETSARSRLTAIELDPLTASIARKLYPDADIRAQGLRPQRSWTTRSTSRQHSLRRLQGVRSSVQRPQFPHPRLLLREGNREGEVGRIDRLHHVERHAREGQLRPARLPLRQGRLPRRDSAAEHRV